MRIQNVLLDLDGTLTDSAPGIIKCIRHALHEMGHQDVLAEDLKWCLGPPIHKSFEVLLDTTNAPEIERALALYRDRFSSIGWLENSVYEGVEEGLSTLRDQEIQLYVATSKPEIYARQILDHFGLSGSFRSIFGSELNGTRSNKGELIGFLVAESGIDVRSSVMIGDRKHDVIGAQTNVMASIGVTYGYGSVDELKEAGADRLCGSPREWWNVIEEL